ncbi:MAG: hypothetical protein ABJA85_01005 [Bacteroidota bacterium]
MNFKEQKEICKKYNAPFVETPVHLKVGISRNVKNNIYPINGLRHPPEGDTTGWYIWKGNEFSDSPGFFVPLHVEHLKDCCPEIIKYLGLAAGWRFRVTNDYEDVWEDISLLSLD